MKFAAVILAGGISKRFGSEEELKQNIMLNGKPVWKHVYDTAESHFDEIAIVGKDVPRGETRQESVSNGIFSIDDCDYVVIFDAARPLVTHEQIEEIKKEVIESCSVSFGVEPTDTILYEGNYRRSGLIALQVPQAFWLDMLRAAHEKTHLKNATDDTIIFEDMFGVKPKILTGGANLYKLTDKDDLKILKALCEK